MLTWGESHGIAMGAVIDGCPAGLRLTPEDIDCELARDVPDKELGTARCETNKVRILSGLFEGLTLGTPISLLIENTDVKSRYYEKGKDLPRPGHADLTYRLKYGHVDWRGGGRASGRECISRVAAGAVARVILRGSGIQVSSRVVEMAGVNLDGKRALARARRIALSEKKRGGSTGGMAEVVISGLPAGLGSPVFDKLEADLAAAVLSIGGVRSFAIGQGCEAARSTGPDFNDAIVLRDGRIGTRTNRAGGVLGGISTGEEVWFRFAVKPTPSVRRPQRTVNVADMRPCTVRSNGHFDANFTPRAAVVAEAMACLVAVDHLLESGLVHPCRWALSPLLKPGKPES